jgi:hypothetical protein
MLLTRRMVTRGAAIVEIIRLCSRGLSSLGGSAYSDLGQVEHDAPAMRENAATMAKAHS